MGGRSRSGWAAALVMLFAMAAGSLSAQEAPPRTILLFGPRVGVSVVFQDSDQFNGDMQSLLHAPDSNFFPLFSEIGIGAQQLFPLGKSGSYLTFQQTLLLGGLEQRMPLPSVFVTFGYRFPFGLELGLGPYATLAPVDGNPGFAFSMVYTAGWAFVMPDFQVPITVMFVPIPAYTNPRVSLLFGLSFWSLR